MFAVIAAALLTVLQFVSGQSPDATYKCLTAGGCVAQNTSIVLESGQHWIRKGDSVACTTSSGVDATLYPNATTCTKNCKIQGIINDTAQGVDTSGNSTTLNQYTMGANGLQSVGPRVYLLGSNGNYVSVTTPPFLFLASLVLHG